MNSAQSPSESYPTPEMEELFQAVLTMKTPAEMAAFFRDLLTLPEITEFANRWQIVKGLQQKQSYQAIAKRLKVSTTTVTRVAFWLHHGLGGYAKAVERLDRK